MTNSINNIADAMLDKISTVTKEELKSSPKIESAIVNNVNEDGTVDVYFPPDENHIFTRISNQTPFTLYPGDSVELMLKNGTFSNCWVIGKHMSSYEPVQNIVNNSLLDFPDKTEFNNFRKAIKETERDIYQHIATAEQDIVDLKQRVTTLENNYTALEKRVAALEARPWPVN